MSGSRHIDTHRCATSLRDVSTIVNVTDILAVMSTVAPSVNTLPLLTACCRSAPADVMPVAAAEQLAGVLKAIADPVRLRLISLVSAHEDGETCVCDLIEPVGLSQPTVSHHLRILVDAGVLTREQRGRWAYFRLVPETLDAVARAITPEPG